MAARQARTQRETSSSWEVVDIRIIVSLFLGLLLAALLAWGLKYLTSADTLPLQAIEVEGDFNKVEAAQIQQALSDVELGGLFSVDVDQVRRITESIPWVEKVTVSRKWPDILHLNVHEHKAAALWGKKALLSSKGIIFQAPRDTYPEDLPVFHGPSGQEQAVLNAFAQMNQLLAAIDLHVVQLEMDERRAWQVGLNNHIQLKLGRMDREKQLLRFVHVYPRFLSKQEQRIDRIDLRYTNGFAVEWKSAQSRVNQAVQETAYV